MFMQVRFQNSPKETTLEYRQPGYIEKYMIDIKE